MRTTFRVLFYPKRDKQKKDGSMPLFCRITVGGKAVRFGMKRDIHPKYWDVKAGKATGRSDEAADINALINSTKSTIHKVYWGMLEHDSCVTAEKVKNAFLGIDTTQYSLLNVFAERNERKALVGITPSKSIYNKYRITRDHLSRYFQKDCHLTDIPLKEIDHKFICGFEQFILTTRVCSKNTTAKYLQLFKHVIIVALKYEWIFKNPFADYRIKTKKLTVDF